MRNLWRGGLAVLGAIAISAAVVTGTHAQQVNAWSPKPTQPTPYMGVNKPLTKLSDVLAGRDPAVSWRQKIVDEGNVTADYVGMAAGGETRRSLSADHRTAFIVWEGQVEVTIQGQPTIMARKGTMIQVPARNDYKLKNVGKTPSLHFEIYVPESTDLYPENSATLPPPPPSFAWYLTRIDAPDVWTRPTTKPVFRHYLDAPSAQEFVSEDRLFVNAIRGAGPSTIPPDTDVGHLHSYGEFWFIMEGTMGYKIEGLSYFTATPGDVVYAAPGRWHRAGTHAGTGQGTRVAINGYPRGSHHWPPSVNPVPATPAVQNLAPLTRTAISSVTSNGWYLQPTVKLTAYPNANSGDDDMDYSEYWLDGASKPTRYAGPFQISGDGMHTLVYRSVDKAGNVEDPKTVTVGVINLPPLTLQAVPSTLNLRTSGGLVTTVITAQAGHDLRAWGVTDIRAEGAPAVSAAYSSDGRTIVATFNKAAFASLPAGNEVRITVTGQFNYNGAQAPLVASTLVRVIR